MANNHSTPYTARSVSTAHAHRQAEKFFTADFVQYGDTFATIRNILADYPKFCRFSAENDRLHFANNGDMLLVQSEKEIAERGNSNNIKRRTSARLLSRAFFVRGLRIPKENTASNFGFCILLSMVGRNGQRLVAGCFPFEAVFHPVTLYRQAWKLAVDVKNLQTEFSTMLFKFLITGSRRLTISIRANSEMEARQRLQLSDNALCVARYTDAFLAKKQVNFTACKGACYA